MFLPPVPVYDLSVVGSNPAQWLREQLANRKNDMPKALADSKNKEFKAAKAKLDAKGVTKPKHEPGMAVAGVKALWPHTGTTTGEGSAPASSAASSKATTMSTAQTASNANSKQKPPPSAKAAETANKAAEQMAASDKAAADKKAAEKSAAIKAKAEQKQKDEAAKAAKAKEKADAKAAADKERAEKKAKADAERAARPVLTPTASMSALRERVASGAYVKSMTGQMRSDDELARALDAVPPANVVALAMMVFGEANKYAALNVGQQSMNYRNRLRGAIRANDGKGLDLGGGKVVTLDYIKSVRDANNFATAEKELAAKAEAKAAREAAAEQKKLAALAAKQASATPAPAA